MAPYFDSIRNPSTFKAKARSENAQAFDSLFKPTLTRHPVSSWGRNHLFALRVLCVTPTSNLGVLESYLPGPSDETLRDAHLQALIDGPAQDSAALSRMSELEIVRSYNPDSLGSVWATLGALLRPQNNQRVNQDGNRDDNPDDNRDDNQDDDQDDDQDHEHQGGRPRRNRQQPDFYGDFVPTDSIQFGSSPPGQRPSSSSTIGSVGYTENLQAPALEDLTVRLASCFIRYVLNYGQEPRARVAEYRDDRVTVSYELQTEPKHGLQAIDDGGVRMFQADQVDTTVALLEAKRRFQVIEDGRPTVSDRLLAQMVGQALISLAGDQSLHVSATSVITIHATRQYVRFFHFELPLPYLDHFYSGSLSPDDDSDLYLSVEASDWFDMTTKPGRKSIVRHLLALVQWAYEEAGDVEDVENDEDEDMEDDE